MKFFLEPGWMHSDFDSVVVVDDDSFIPWLWIDCFLRLLQEMSHCFGADRQSWMRLDQFSSANRIGDRFPPTLFRTVPKRKEFETNAHFSRK